MIKKIFNFLNDDDIAILSAAMTFWSIFATIPVLILVIWLFTNMPIFDSYYEKFHNIIFELILPDKSTTILHYINIFLSKNSDLDLKYFLYIFIVSVVFFKNYEMVISKILNFKQRSYLKVTFIYISLIILMPIVLISLIYLWDFFDIYFISFFLSWGLFFMLFLVVSFSSYRIKNIIFASFIGSFAWFITKVMFVYYMLYAKTYATLYDSFAVLFVFLFWIYISWMTYLYSLKFLKNSEIKH